MLRDPDFGEQGEVRDFRLIDIFPQANYHNGYILHHAGGLLLGNATSCFGVLVRNSSPQAARQPTIIADMCLLHI